MVSRPLILAASVAAFAASTFALPSLAGPDSDGLTAVVGTPQKDWTFELESGDLWTKVLPEIDDGPITIDTSNHYYDVVPIHFTASLRLTEVGLDDFLGGVFRGYSEFYFSAQYNKLVHSPKNENQYGGLMVGPRYNFVQPGWKVIPYFEVGVGLILADDDPEPRAHNTPEGGGLGQAENFGLDVALGLRYDLSEDFFVRLGAEYNHVSNAGLSEPRYANNGIDAFGPVFSFGYAF